MIKSLQQYIEGLDEKIRNQDDMKLMRSVLKANDIEVKFTPKQGQDSTLKVRAKSVDKNKVFTMFIRDIELTDIGSSINVGF